MLNKNAEKELKELYEKGFKWSDLEKARNVMGVPSEVITLIKNDLFNYQLKIVECDRNNILCNWSRGLGATFTIARMLVIKRPKKVVYQSQSNLLAIKEAFNELEYKYKDFKSLIKDIKTSEDYVSITWFDDKVTNVYSYSGAKKKNPTSTVFDYIIFDNQLPFSVDLNRKQVISFVTINSNQVNLEKLLPQCYMLQSGLIDGLNNSMYTARTIEKYKDEDGKFMNVFYRDIDILHESHLVQR